MRRRSQLVVSIAALALAAAACGSSAGARSDETVLEEMVAIGHTTLDPYYDQSNPAPYAEQFATEGSYFDPWTPGRLDGTAIEQHLMSFAGLIPLSRYEIVDPAVDVLGDTAVFTFNVVTYDPDGDAITSRWNATEVRNRAEGGWTLVHAHWSPTEPGVDATG